MLLRSRRLAALACAVAVLTTACAGGDRPSLGDDAPVENAVAPTVEALDAQRTYVATVDGPIDRFDGPDADEPSGQLRPPAAGGDVRVFDGFVVAAPYDRFTTRYEVHLDEGGTAWVDSDDVAVQATNVVAIGKGTDVNPDGSGGGEVAVFDQPGAAQPSQQITNPKSAEGLNVGPVAFLANGPYDPSAEFVSVFLPVRPNGSTGFVRAGDVDVSTNRFRIEVSLGAHQLKLFDGEQQVLQEPIGVGTGNTPTPGGVFYIRSLIASTDPVYGTYAFGLSGFSDVHQSFNGGPGDIGIHGTNDPSTIGTDVSNGCIRLHDDTVVHLASVLPEASGPQSEDPQVSTGLGVPVQVLA